MLAATNFTWIGIGLLVLAVSTSICGLMLNLSRSEKVQRFMYKDHLRFQRFFHLKIVDYAAFRRGIRVGFGIAAAWGLAGVIIGVGLVIVRGF